MRGKGACNQAVCPDNGITPAYAGKRQIGQRAKLPPWDHPRVCGEKVVPLVWMTCDIGSPPRMRGKVITVERNQLPRGITPAYAGKSTVPDVAGIPAEDHPRVCGEKQGTSFCKSCSIGSPPRMRGKVSALQSGASSHGITPAYAGKSSVPSLIQSLERDHPRVCGEKWLFPPPALKPLGSPPHMRGKGNKEIIVVQIRRITPAYAGKSALAVSANVEHEDHPRICGEKSCI